MQSTRGEIHQAWSCTDCDCPASSKAAIKEEEQWQLAPSPLLLVRIHPEPSLILNAISWKPPRNVAVVFAHVLLGMGILGMLKGISLPIHAIIISELQRLDVRIMLAKSSLKCCWHHFQFLFGTSTPPALEEDSWSRSRIKQEALLTQIILFPSSLVRIKINQISNNLLTWIVN